MPAARLRPPAAIATMCTGPPRIRCLGIHSRGRLPWPRFQPVSDRLGPFGPQPPAATRREHRIKLGAKRVSPVGGVKAAAPDHPRGGAQRSLQARRAPAEERGERQQRPRLGGGGRA